MMPYRSTHSLPPLRCRRGWGPLRMAVAAGFSPALSAAWMAVAGLGMLSCGCSSVHPPDEQLVPAKTPALAEPAVRYRIGFLPLTIDEKFSAHMRAKNDGGSREYVYLPNDDVRRKLVEEVAEAIGEIGAFDEIKYLPGGNADDMENVLRAGWAENLDVIARPVLRRHDCYYVDKTGAWVPNLLLWLVASPIASWWVADEKFGSITLLEIELYSTATRETRPFAVLEAKGDVQHDLDDFQQGFNLLNLFITPAGLSPGHWQDIGAHLLPLSRQLAQREWLEKAHADAPGSFRFEIEAKRRTVLDKALVVVCGGTPANSDVPRFAGADVTTMREFFIGDNGRHAIAREWAVTSLDGPRASRRGLLAAVRQTIVRYARQGDVAWLVVSGRGVFDNDGAWLLLNDSTRENYRETGLPMADLAAEFAALRCPAIVVASVSWEWAGKTAADETHRETRRETRGEPGASGEPELIRSTSDSAEADRRSPWAALTALPNVAVFSATHDALPVLEMEQIPGSLFLAELVRHGDNGDAIDDNGDGWLSLAELAAAVKTSVTTLTQREGIPQVPRLYGRSALTERPLIRLKTAPVSAADGE